MASIFCCQTLILLSCFPQIFPLVFFSPCIIKSRSFLFPAPRVRLATRWTAELLTRLLPEGSDLLEVNQRASLHNHTPYESRNAGEPAAVGLAAPFPTPPPHPWVHDDGLLNRAGGGGRGEVCIADGIRRRN